MICKERNPNEHPESDKYSEAGQRAEDQMAFYLKRSFQDDPEIWVFNDLRYRSDTNDVAQIDHLVLHRSGFIVIESKSVTSKVRIHKNGEWERIWNNHWQGMRSPIKQAELQIGFLRMALDAYREQLLGKTIIGQQQRFRKMPFEVLIAISDGGSIERKGEYAEVSKADLIPDRVREIVQRHKKARSLFNISLSDSMDGAYNLKDEEMEAIRKWLVNHHYPKTMERPNQAKATPPPILETVETPMPPPLPVAKPPPIPASSATIGSAPHGVGMCEKCGQQSQILWGKYGYYWKCPACLNNMPLKEYCPRCKGKMKVRKDGLRFYKHCELCKTPEVLLYEG